MKGSETLIDLAIGKKIMEQLYVFKYQDILCGIVVMDQKTIDDAAYFQFTKHIPKDQLDFEANQSPHLAVDLLDRYGDIDVLFIAFAYKKNGKQSYRISVRSYGEKGNGLAKMIAEQFGGSGHHNAAGGQFLEEDKYLITTKIMNAINIKKNK